VNDAVRSERPALEVADVIRSHGEAFLNKHGSHLRPEQKKALYALASCRTAALGGHVERCLDCGHARIAYNSCRNRHCPKCQALHRAKWLAREATYLLSVEYHHVVFTVPQEVAALASANPALVYGLLFEAARTTLREVAANPARLGAQIGVLAVLHTWGQNLHHHPHLHCVVTGGGLSCDAQGQVETAEASPRWVSCRPGFFLPVRVLSRVFRGKFRHGLHRLFAEGTLVFPDRLAALAEPKKFAAWQARLGDKEWVVHAKPPFGGPERVLKYLARYTHRVAISNQRLLKMEDGRVTFRYKDYADPSAKRRVKTMTLSAEEFLRRFVEHVLPKGFVKIRHYGLLGQRHRKERLALCRSLLGAATAALLATMAPGPPAPSGTETSPIAPAAPISCPRCGGTRLARSDLFPPPEPSAELRRTPPLVGSPKGAADTS
jgi:Putative transposase/Transposase zinc-binding domain